jgi:phenylalanyl-tRNA synthetase beta subunit
LRVILELQGASAKDFSFSQFPSVARDLTLTLPLDCPVGEITAQIRAELAKRELIHRIECTSIYQADGAKTKNVSFHLSFARTDKTLEKSEIQDIMKALEKIK